MYPLKITPIFKKKIWGGRALMNQLDKKLPDKDLYGESWEASAHPNGMGMILNGRFSGLLFADVFADYGKEIIGERLWQKYNGQFPLLLKFLDINDKLSLQVHPDNNYALKTCQSFGKAECWYIISASPDAKVVMGIREDITFEYYAQQAVTQNFEGLFNEIIVKEGDLIVIPPGMVHGTLAGSLLIFEIQQNSDLTYRIYDFDRLENGMKRTLHYQESLENIDFSLRPNIRNFKNNKKQEILLDWEYFLLSQLVISGSYSISSIDALRFYTSINGTVSVFYNNHTFVLHKAEVLVLPAFCSIDIYGDAVLFEILPY